MHVSPDVKKKKNNTLFSILFCRTVDHHDVKSSLSSPSGMFQPARPVITVLSHLLFSRRRDVRQRKTERHADPNIDGNSSLSQLGQGDPSQR